MPILEVDLLCKTFGGLSALRDLTFAIEEGTITGLIGPNGSGKTTLFNCIAGALKPTKGRIALSGRNVTGLPPYRISAAGIARTFQLSKTFESMTVREHVVAARLFGGSDRAFTKARATRDSEETLVLVGLEHLSSERLSSLGTVDRKRVEVARALGTRPVLLLLDEMMAGLNSREIEDTMLMVKRIRDSGVTVILVEHVMKAVMGVSDRVMVLSAGEKICEGAPSEVVCNRRVIEAYLGEKYRS